MKQSEKNLLVIENFILHITGSSDDTDREKIGYSPFDLYQMAKDYIKEDHVDGEQNPEDEIGVVAYNITIIDITTVANDLNMNPSIEELREVLRLYPNEERQNLDWNWTKIVENILYNVITPSKIN